MGELSLSGELRPVRGLLAMIMAAVKAGLPVVVVPAEQVLGGGVGSRGRRWSGVANLEEAVAWWLQGGTDRTTAAEPRE